MPLLADGSVCKLALYKSFTPRGSAYSKGIDSMACSALLSLLGEKQRLVYY